MARTTTNTCDVCKKPCEHIVAKMYYGPMVKGSSKAYHSNYSHHLDVGECCGVNAPGRNILKIFNWRERMSAKEYAESRKNGK
jgi:hypothetical protein